MQDALSEFNLFCRDMSRERDVDRARNPGTGDHWRTMLGGRHGNMCWPRPNDMVVTCAQDEGVLEIWC